MKPQCLYTCCSCRQFWCGDAADGTSGGGDGDGGGGDGGGSTEGS